MSTTPPAPRFTGAQHAAAAALDAAELHYAACAEALALATAARAQARADYRATFDDAVASPFAVLRDLREQSAGPDPATAPDPADPGR